MFLAMARPRPVPARRVVKYGSKMRGRSSSAMPLPRSRIVMATRRSPSRCVIRRRPARRRPAARLRRLGGCWALVSRLTSTVRSRSPSVTSSGSAGARLERRPGRGRGRRCGGRTASRQTALMSVGAGVEANRPRDVEHVVDEAVQPIDLLVDVVGRVAHVGGGGAVASQRAQRALDDHQRVAHFVRDHRRQPAERRQPLALRRPRAGSARSSRSAC